MELPPLMLVHSIALLFLVIASIIDIRIREVPDFLNFSLIGIGGGIAIISSLILNSWWPLLNSIIGFAVAYGVAAAMYYGGQWGGGDAKMLMGLGALHGVSITQLISGEIPLFITIIISIFLAGAIYGIGYAKFLVFKKWKRFWRTFVQRLQRHKQQRRAITIVCILLVLLFFIAPTNLKFVVGALLFVIFFSYYAFNAGKVVEEVCMVKKTSVSQLTEGDWLVNPVKYNNKILVKPTTYGLTTEQITTLKKYKIKAVTIKEGIPFIPGFLLGYLVIVVFGNWIPLVLSNLL